MIVFACLFGFCKIQNLKAWESTDNPTVYCVSQSIVYNEEDSNEWQEGCVDLRLSVGGHRCVSVTQIYKMI